MEPTHVDYEGLTEGMSDSEDSNTVAVNPNLRSPAWLNRPINTRLPTSIGGPRFSNEHLLPKARPSEKVEPLSDEPKNISLSSAKQPEDTNSSDIRTLTCVGKAGAVGANDSAQNSREELVIISKTDWISLLTSFETLEVASKEISTEIVKLKGHFQKFDESQQRNIKPEESPIGSGVANAGKELSVGKRKRKEKIVTPKPKQKSKTKNCENTDDESGVSSGPTKARKISIPKWHGCQESGNNASKR